MSKFALLVAVEVCFVSENLSTIVGHLRVAVKNNMSETRCILRIIKSTYMVLDDVFLLAHIYIHRYKTKYLCLQAK